MQGGGYRHAITSRLVVISTLADRGLRGKEPRFTRRIDDVRPRPRSGSPSNVCVVAVLISSSNWGKVFRYA